MIASLKSRLSRVAWRGRLAALALGALFTTAAWGQAAVGTTAGQFAVDSGAATYSIPISLPPGSGSMAPELALSYSSNGGSGVFGQGWQLSGLSAIGRCPATLVNDGFIDRVDFDANDRLCLDGQRLVAVTGTYGAAGTEYRKEIDDFTKVVAYGGINNPDAMFIAYTKSGLIYHYGYKGTTSQMKAPGAGATLRGEVLGWSVFRITDKAGNYISFDYSQDSTNKEQLLTKVSYTGNAGASVLPYNTVELVYEARPAGTERRSWFNGGQITQAQRVKAIVVKTEGTLVREYRLAYAVARTVKISQLTSVTECVGSTCLKPTTFTWTAEQAPGFNAVASTGFKPYRLAKTFPIDINGDGRTDLFTKNSGTGTGYQQLRSDGDGTFTPVSMSNAATATDVEFGDIDGNGMIDVLYGEDVVSGLYKYTKALNTNGVLATPVALGEPANLNLLPESIKPGYEIADFTGDGRMDILTNGCRAYTPAGCNPKTYYLYEGTGTGFPQSLFRQTTITHKEGEDQWNRHVGDFNGDGLLDVVHDIGNDGSFDPYYVYFNNGQGFDAAVRTHAQMQVGNNRKLRDVAADFNGDGLTDMLIWGEPFGGAYNLFLATGSSTAPFADPIKIPNVRGYSERSGNNVMVVDANADGLPDIMMYNISALTNTVNETVKTYALYLNTGGAFADPINSGVNTADADGLSDSDSNNNKIGDFNGDGATDLLVWTKPTGDVYNIYFGTKPVPPAIKVITTGLGAQIGITYKPLTDASVYTKGSGVSYPTQDVLIATPVVSDFVQSDGIGGYRSTTYFYTGLRADALRGSLGFATVKSTDVQTGLSTTTTHLQSFPHTGAVASSTLRTAAGKTVSSTANTYSVAVLGSGTSERFLPTLKKSESRAYDITSAATPLPVVSSTVTNNTYDPWGNLTLSTTSTYKGDVGTSTPHVTRTTSTYAAADATNWTLGRLLTTKVEKNLPGGAIMRRESAFEYDSKGLLSAEIVEPNNAALKLRTAYSRDVFGNLTVTRVGAGTPEERASSVTYDAKGRYPVSSTNAVGHVTRTTYDARWGQPTRIEDPNHTASQPVFVALAYDVFGRKTHETNTGNDTTTIVRQWCTDALCGAYGSLAKMRIETRTPDGGRSAVILDALERQIGAERLAFDGRWSRQRTLYDARGLVDRTTEPYFDGGTVHLTTHDYDEFGRPILEVGAAHQGDASGGRVTTIEYGPLWTKQTDARGKVRWEYKNEVGQVVRVVDPDGKQSTYQYDAFGNLVKTIDAMGNVSTLGYDVRGLKIRSDDPDMGVWTYTYTRFGELKTQTDAKLQTVQFTYDKLGRMVKRVEPEGTTAWTYDTRWKGALTSVTAPGGYAEAYHYTVLGQVASKTLYIGGVYYTYDYAYDYLGRLLVTTYPAGLQVVQRYNAYGYLSSVINASGAPYVTIDAGDARGNTTGFVYGNGVATQRSFDAARGFPRGVSATLDATTLHLMAFDWDVIGNLAKRRDLRRNLTEAFVYDNLNRLSTAAVTGPVNSTHSFTYDAVGNILSKTGIGNYTYGAGTAGPHAVTSITGTRPGTFAYDANGNMISGWGRSLTWSSYNLPTRITEGTDTVQFQYGPNRERLVQTETGLVPRTVTYVGGLYEKQVVGSSVAHRQFVQAMGETIAIVNTGATVGTHYLHRDHQESVTVLTDQSGAVIERLSYDAFGKRRNDINWSDDPGDALLQTNLHKTDRGYTGHEHLDRVGLIHMNGRVYDAALGRFISPDPFVQFPMSTQGMNRYTYVDNNPLSFTDPSGFLLSGLKKAFKSVLKFLQPFASTIATVAICGNPATAPVGCMAAVAATTAGAQTAMAGGSTSDILKSAGVSVASVYAFNTIGTKLPFKSMPVANVVAHGTVGGLTSVVMGGKFQAGFIGAATGAALSPYAHALGGHVANATGSDIAGVIAGSIASGVAGGTAEKLAGGKFANGATTAAFGYAFNWSAHDIWERIKGASDIKFGVGPGTGAGLSYGCEDPTECGSIGIRASFRMKFMGAGWERGDYSLNLIDFDASLTIDHLAGRDIYTLFRGVGADTANPEREGFYWLLPPERKLHKALDPSRWGTVRVHIGTPTVGIDVKVNLRELLPDR